MGGLFSGKKRMLNPGVSSFHEHVTLTLTFWQVASTLEGISHDLQNQAANLVTGILEESIKSKSMFVILDTLSMLFTVTRSVVPRSDFLEGMINKTCLLLESPSLRTGTGRVSLKIDQILAGKWRDQKFRKIGRIRKNRNKNLIVWNIKITVKIPTEFLMKIDKNFEKILTRCSWTVRRRTQREEWQNGWYKLIYHTK